MSDDDRTVNIDLNIAGDEEKVIDIDLNCCPGLDIDLNYGGNADGVGPTIDLN